MNKLKTNWAPFPHEYSSCSRFKPESFQWSRNEGIANVVIDNQILSFVKNNNNEKNFGWFCESSEILPDLKKYLKTNIQLLKTKFLKIFTSDYEIISWDPNFFLFNPPGSNLPWTPKERFKIKEKTKLCSMICSAKDMTSGHKLRLEIAQGYKNRLELFGGALGSPKIGDGFGPKGDWWRSKEQGLSDFMFSVVFENSNTDKYYTEKITDCFALGVVPIYWGTNKIAEDFDNNGIIKWDKNFSLDMLSEDLYFSKMDAIKINLEKVKELKSADDQLFDKIKKLI